MTSTDAEVVHEEQSLHVVRLGPKWYYANDGTEVLDEALVLEWYVSTRVVVVLTEGQPSKPVLVDED